MEGMSVLQYSPEIYGLLEIIFIEPIVSKLHWSKQALTFVLLPKTCLEADFWRELWYLRLAILLSLHYIEYVQSWFGSTIQLTALL